MTPDQELVLIFGLLHLVALSMGVILFVMFLRSDTTRTWRPPKDDDPGGGGGGGNDRLGDGPKPRPTGGIPLPDAEQAKIRLRGHETLFDQLPEPERRPAREPARPVREPQRAGR